jgi:hypothetical protein
VLKEEEKEEKEKRRMRRTGRKLIYLGHCEKISALVAPTQF